MIKLFINDVANWIISLRLPNPKWLLTVLPHPWNLIICHCNKFNLQWFQTKGKMAYNSMVCIPKGARSIEEANIRIFRLMYYFFGWIRSIRSNLRATNIWRTRRNRTRRSRLKITMSSSIKSPAIVLFKYPMTSNLLAIDLEAVTKIRQYKLPQ